MFDNKIDVAEIMHQIKAQIEPEEEKMNSVLYRLNNPTIKNVVYEFDKTKENLLKLLEVNREFVNIYQSNIPMYNKYGRIPGKIFRFIARCVRKCNEYLFKNQIKVNQTYMECLKEIIENQDQLVKSFVYVDRLSTECVELEQRICKIEKELIKGNILCKESTADSTYDEFEDKYRGTESVIKNRLKYYLDEVVVPNISKESEALILDIGCGRGEWLELLREYGYHPVGVDMNADMVKRAQRKGLTVIESDALAYIRSLPDNSVCLATAFQVIEHISYNELNELIKELYRVLEKDGVIILETPNAANIKVGSYNFYLDPTHNKPIHHQFLEFIAEKSGFEKIKIVNWNQNEIDEWWTNVLSQNEEKLMDSPLFRTIVETVKENFYISPDYALIAQK